LAAKAVGFERTKFPLAETRVKLVSFEFFWSCFLLKN